MIQIHHFYFSAPTALKIRLLKKNVLSVFVLDVIMAVFELEWVQEQTLASEIKAPNR